MTEKLNVEREIAASPDAVFAAWTKPELMEQWWGPGEVTGFGIEIDLRVGGKYRIGNRLPDNGELWICGTFIEISSPDRLVYTWAVEPDEETEQVTVHFEPIPFGTRVVLTHERIGSVEKRDDHLAGWLGCIDGLATHFC